MLNVKNLIEQGQITKNELLNALQEVSKSVELNDIVHCSLRIRKEGECIHTSYKKEYIKTEIGLIIRIKEVKDDQLNYNGQIDVEELKSAVELLLEQKKTAEAMEELELVMVKIYSILSLYTTFIKEEPIHQVGTPFPGGFIVKKEGNKYTCPVKDNNQDNPLALCPFCIAEQDEEV
ncbi:MAG: DUF2115 family protein [Methanobacteriaceae archaeon]|nr:DUF2115 family protein [Methanobacteriaceae archaeon]